MLEETGLPYEPHLVDIMKNESWTPDAERAARELLGRALYPRFFRVLFGLDLVGRSHPEREVPGPGPELAQIRSAVADIMRRHTTRRPHRGRGTLRFAEGAGRARDRR